MVVPEKMLRRVQFAKVVSREIQESLNRPPARGGWVVDGKTERMICILFAPSLRGVLVDEVTLGVPFVDAVMALTKTMPGLESYAFELPTVDGKFTGLVKARPPDIN